MTDPYSVLGVSRDASADEIKKAYRKLSRIYHPDANVNNPNKAQEEEKFKEIQEAYNLHLPVVRVSLPETHRPFSIQQFSLKKSPEAWK